MYRYLVGGIVALVVFSAGALLAGPRTNGDLVELATQQAVARSGACMYPGGGWAIVNCSNVAAASSAQLNEWSRYVVQCGDDSYLATGTATGQDADSSDGWLPAGAWLEFITTDSVRFISCLNKTADSDCRILQCR
jgi:hypothetical protein